MIKWVHAMPTSGKSYFLNNHETIGGTKLINSDSFDNLEALIQELSILEDDVILLSNRYDSSIFDEFGPPLCALLIDGHEAYYRNEIRRQYDVSVAYLPFHTFNDWYCNAIKFYGLKYLNVTIYTNCYVSDIINNYMTNN